MNRTTAHLLFERMHAACEESPGTTPETTSNVPRSVPPPTVAPLAVLPSEFQFLTDAAHALTDRAIARPTRRNITKVIDAIQRAHDAAKRASGQPSTPATHAQETRPENSGTLF